MKTLQSLRPLILVLGATTAVAGTAAADDPDAPRQRVVSFGDLNLDHPDGVKALFGRLTRAARAVCEQPSSGPHALWADERKCAKTALGNAVADVDNNNLTAYYKNRTGDDRFSEEKVASRR